MRKQACPFCNSSDEVLKENELARLIPSDPHRTFGHLLVVPKRHIEKPWNLEEDELLAIYELIFYAQKKLTEKVSEGCDIRQNFRPFLEQSKLKIDHLHYHVIPRDWEDEIYQVAEQYEGELFQSLSGEERRKIEELI